jgi:hypothetical protein
VRRVKVTKTELKKMIRQGHILGDDFDKIRPLVLRHGTFFPRQSDVYDNPFALAWKRRYRPKPKRCFYNSQKFAKENFHLDHAISYWEGVVLYSDLLFVHAWNTIGGDVIDLTLTGKNTVYLGVEIDRMFLFDFETQRWENPPHPGGPYLPEYFKDGRYKDYPLPDPNI